MSNTNSKEQFNSETAEQCGRTNGKSRGRRRGNKPKMKDNYKGNKPNDIGWHAKSNQLLTDSASVPWSYSTGRNLIRGRAGTAANLTEGTLNVPGIFALKTVLTPGVSTTQSDAINIAAQALYTDIRSQLKSANAYDSSDVMIYMCAMAEIKAMIAFLRRILGTPLNFSFMNSYLPDDLILAQGVSPDGLKRDLAMYRSRINQNIAKASQIWWPKGFDYVTRAEWEYGAYYTEGESIKDQIYMFTPGLFRKFTYDESRDYAGMLVPCIKFDFNDPVTIDDVINALSDMIDAVVGDTDFQNIAGDLFNRYGAGGVETFSLIPDAYIINPSLSFEVLEQMQNAKCLSFVYDMFNALDISYPEAIDLFCVKQDEANNMLLINNKHDWIVGNTDAIKNYKIDSYYPVFTVDKDPSPTKTMLITRCANVITDLSATIEGDNTKFTITYDAAMELVVGFEFYVHVNDTLARSTLHTSMTGMGLSHAYRMSCFHYHPLIQQANNTGAGTFAPLPQLLGSIDIYTVISPEQIKDMNRVDLMSLFAVPNVGSVNK